MQQCCDKGVIILTNPIAITRIFLYSFMDIGLAVDEAILALWMIFWRGLVSFAVEPFGLCILKPLLPLTATLEGVSIFITVSLGEVGCFSDPTSHQNSLVIL